MGGGCVELYYRGAGRRRVTPQTVPMAGADSSRRQAKIPVQSGRGTLRTDEILVPMRKDSRADEKKFSWARERIACRRENVRYFAFSIGIRRETVR